MQTLGTGAAKLNLEFQIGSARDITFTFAESDGTSTDISLWTFELFFKKYAGERAKTISLTLGDGLSFPVYEDNQLLAEFTTTDTAIEEGEYYWELRRTDENIPLINGSAFFSFTAETGDIDTVSVTTGDQTVAITIYGSSVSAATQSEVNAGTVTNKYVSPDTLDDYDPNSSVLTDAATIALTGQKHTLTTATGRTFTNSHTGDFIVINITLNATSATFTFPSGYLCSYAGTASGDNTLVITGATSGDLISVAVVKVGSQYLVAGQNFGQ